MAAGNGRAHLQPRQLARLHSVRLVQDQHVSALNLLQQQLSNLAVAAGLARLGCLSSCCGCIAASVLRCNAALLVDSGVAVQQQRKHSSRAGRARCWLLLQRMHADVPRGPASHPTLNVCTLCRFAISWCASTTVTAVSRRATSRSSSAA